MVELRPLMVLVAAVIIATGVTVGVAGAGTGAATVLSARSTALGEILVSSGGRTLYHDSSEPRDRVRCTGSCAVSWPPLVISAHAKPIAGPGVTASLLGTVTRPDGRLQITYRGLPLYRFSGDTKAGDVNGQGVGRVWHALTPAGAIVTKAGSSVSMGSTTTTGAGSGTGTGSGVNAGMWCAANPKSCVNGVPVPGG